MKTSFVLLASTLLIFSICGCGSANKNFTSASHAQSRTSETTSTQATTPSTATTIAGKHKDSNDGDDDPNSNDDSLVLDYGHLASPAEARAIEAVVQSYYTAAAAENGAKGCALLYSLFAENLAEVYTHYGDTCAAIMSGIFKENHQRLMADRAKLKITSVRIEDTKRGLALLSFGTMPVHNIALHREGSAWKIKALMDSEMP